MSLPPGRRTRGEIIEQALTVVGNLKIIAQARVELGRLLDDLYQQHEWPFLYTETTLTMTEEVTLPADFLKEESADTGLRVVTIDGEDTDRAILIVSPSEWRRQALPRDAEGDAPSIAMIDYAAGILKPWPIPSSSCTALLVYKYLPDDVDPADTDTYDADVPVFPYHRYLQDCLEAWGHGYEQNWNAKGMKLAENERALSRLLATAIPRSANAAASLALDAGTFLPAPRVNEA